MFEHTVTVIELLLIAIIYMLPTLVAYARDLPQRGLITVLNLVFGWTLIGWVALFIWALLAETTADEFS